VFAAILSAQNHIFERKITLSVNFRRQFRDWQNISMDSIFVNGNFEPAKLRISNVKINEYFFYKD